MALSFRSLPLPPAVRRGLADAGFRTCTPVQERVLPLSLAGKDVAAQAQTGTGKTAAFLLTLFSRLSAEPGISGPRALVVAPTRELALQILEDGRLLGRYTGLRMTAVYGGMGYRKQREELLAGTDVLVGTPGRLIDFFRQGVYRLDSVEIAVVDEADRLFDLGFLRDLRFLLRRLPPFERRQSLLFSATLSYRVLELAYEYMNDPVRIVIDAERITAEGIEHTVFHVGREEKLALLLGLLRREKPRRALIFVNEKRTAERLERSLRQGGFAARAMTGRVDQRTRLRLLEDFKSGALRLLVATDVASRGLHVDGVTHVFNYDLPEDPENYVHRVGRTGRAGARGKALSLACDRYVWALESIEKVTGFKIPVAEADESLFRLGRSGRARTPSRRAGR
ncbi:MAG: ATP-dependent RNA helicase RhlB [Candidatus Binatia bacterium]|nr:MAG: ATP-dependent RNA helicase RhlB [Candidatus Binatia bacterium]